MVASIINRGKCQENSDLRQRLSRQWHMALYNTSAWRKLRACQLATEPLCRMCLAEGRVTEATVADHVIPHRGDPDLFWHGELQSLCGPCHSRFKQSAEKGGGKHLAGCGPDGEPLFFKW